MADAYIVDAVRTPTGRRRGGLADVHGADLGAHVLKALVERNGIPDADYDDVIFGCLDAIGPLARDLDTLERVSRVVSNFGEGDVRGHGATLAEHGVEQHEHDEWQGQREKQRRRYHHPRDLREHCHPRPQQHPPLRREQPQ